MDLIKIGKFISTKRKEKGITQSELAERLYVSDRAVSKWENGVCLPDAGNMQELCSILNISINDLFSGEVVDMKDNEKRLEENLIEMARLKEERDKELLREEVIIAVSASTTLVGGILLASLVEMPDIVRVLIITISSIIFAIGLCNALKIEQIAGYYECKECHHKYVPTYLAVFFARHVNRTRKMKCPKCGKKTWQKKVLK